MLASPGNLCGRIVYVGSIELPILVYDRYFNYIGIQMKKLAIALLITTTSATAFAGQLKFTREVEELCIATIEQNDGTFSGTDRKGGTPAKVKVDTNISDAVVKATVTDRKLNDVPDNGVLFFEAREGAPESVLGDTAYPVKLNDGHFNVEAMYTGQNLVAGENHITGTITVYCEDKESDL